MFTSLWEDVKREYNYGNMITRIIIVNVSVFVVVNLVRLLLFIFYGGDGTNTVYETFLHFFCASSDLWHNLTHPWVFITSMFLHEGFIHILFNMLFLYWFGRIVGDFIGNQRVLPLYLLGGFVGIIAYILSASFLPVGSFALGASAAVMAIVVAAATISPDYIMRLLFLGDVKLKYIAAVLIFLDLIAIPGLNNTGGHIAHLGGAFFGWFFVKQLRSGQDWSEPVNRLLARISGFFSNVSDGAKSKPRKPKVVFKNTSKIKKGGKGRAVSDTEDLSHQEKLDTILDKIKKAGYESLSQEEKEFLFNASKK